MSEYGYDKERFPNLTGDMFDCPICTNVAVNPKECTGCGDMFCAKCIDDWMRKNKYSLSHPAPAPRDATAASSS
jgi:hypothetical protein